MSAIAGAFCPSQFVAANTCTRPRLAATTAGCTAAVSAASNAPATAAACPAAPSACAAAVRSQPAYWAATAIIAAEGGPSQEPLTNSDVTDPNDAADEANSSARAFHAAAAASNGPAPGPAYM